MPLLFTKETLKEVGDTMNSIETFYGLIETTSDALKVFEATRLGILGRVNRRLHENERNLIRSGSVFVFDEKESGMKRWTDGKQWSPSRILGNFLIYRELEAKYQVGNGSAVTGTINRINDTIVEEQLNHQGNLAFPSTSNSITSKAGTSKRQPRQRKNSYIKKSPEAVLKSTASDINASPLSISNNYVAEVTKSDPVLIKGSNENVNNPGGRISSNKGCTFVFKQDGLIKKTISVRISGRVHHLVCYYSKADAIEGRSLNPIWNQVMPMLRSLEISPCIELERKPYLNSGSNSTNGENTDDWTSTAELEMQMIPDIDLKWSPNVNTDSTAASTPTPSSSSKGSATRSQHISRKRVTSTPHRGGKNSVNNSPSPYGRSISFGSSYRGGGSGLGGASSSSVYDYYQFSSSDDPASSSSTNSGGYIQNSSSVNLGLDFTQLHGLGREANFQIQGHPLSNDLITDYYFEDKGQQHQQQHSHFMNSNNSLNYLSSINETTPNVNNTNRTGASKSNVRMFTPAVGTLFYENISEEVAAGNPNSSHPSNPFEFPLLHSESTTTTSDMISSCQQMTLFHSGSSRQSLDLGIYPQRPSPTDDTPHAHPSSPSLNLLKSHMDAAKGFKLSPAAFDALQSAESESLKFRSSLDFKLPPSTERGHSPFLNHSTIAFEEEEGQGDEAEQDKQNGGENIPQTLVQSNSLFIASPSLFSVFTKLDEH